MTNLNVTFKADEQTERFPIYCKYPDQFNPQRAYISLDLESGECTADYSREIGNSIRADVWHERRLWLSVSPQLTADDIENLINEHAEKFQWILDSCRVVWDGSNHRGVIPEEVRDFLNGWDYDCIGHDIEGGIVDDLVAYCDGVPVMQKGQTLNDMAEHIYDSNGENNFWFCSDLDGVEKIKSAILDIWADQLYAGNDLTKQQALELIADGRCDDSEWTEELKEFAGA